MKESSSRTLLGQVYDYRVPCWRAQYEDNDWEQLTGGAQDGPEHDLTTPKGVPPNPSTSVTSMVC